MPPPKSRQQPLQRKRKENFLVKFYKNYVNYEFVKSLIFDPNRLPIVSVGIIVVEILLNLIVIEKVPYTEIDWKAYMQECGGFLKGNFNYSQLQGDTGPLVYPAGFVYFYSILYFITAAGTNVRLAQYIFGIIYVLQMYLVLRLYNKSRKVPPYVLILSTFTSYRIHSIYVLRLFNDPVAILFLYAALNLFMDQRWTLGSIYYSLAVSMKMNILLFAPALLLLYITNLGYARTIKQLLICAIVQLALGSPFLLTYPIEYIKGSFDLGRIFEHRWTVNYRFLSREIFENRIFHISLLGIHVILLGVFAMPTMRYFQSYCRLRTLQSQLQPQIDRKNVEVARLKKKPNKKKQQVKENSEPEQLTKEQEKFLNAFEKTLQKSSGKQNQNVEETQKESNNEEHPEKYSIHFDKSVQLALLPLFLCNFIGVVCSRSLHYQFYVWYFHSLPYLVWSTRFSLGLRFLLLGFIEYCWNTYPSTNVSSLLLHCCHLVLLFGIGRMMFQSKAESDKCK